MREGNVAFCFRDAAPQRIEAHPMPALGRSWLSEPDTLRCREPKKVEKSPKLLNSTSGTDGSDARKPEFAK